MKRGGLLNNKTISPFVPGTNAFVIYDEVLILLSHYHHSATLSTSML